MDILLLLLSHSLAFFCGLVMFQILLFVIADSDYDGVGSPFTVSEFMRLKSVCVDFKLFAESYYNRLFHDF